MKLRLVALAAASAGIVACAGCGNGDPQPRLSSVSAQHGFKMTRPEAGRSWMSPIAKRVPLLYVSVWDTGVVYVYSYPKAKLLGKLVGILDTPSGMCSDSKGNVWITNFHGEGITEYAHGGTKPIATLSDPGTDPNGCSVDPLTGNLAVTGFLRVLTGPHNPARSRYTRGPLVHRHSIPYRLRLPHTAATTIKEISSLTARVGGKSLGSRFPNCERAKRQPRHLL